MIGTGFYEDDIKEQIAETKKRLDEKYEKYVENILIIGFLLIIEPLANSTKQPSQYLLSSIF